METTAFQYNFPQNTPAGDLTGNLSDQIRSRGNLSVIQFIPYASFLRSVKNAAIIANTAATPRQSVSSTETAILKSPELLSTRSQSYASSGLKVKLLCPLLSGNSEPHRLSLS